uniref:ATP synthase peripheral stalk subunit OSCP, mitochondrial n=1 Tax=Stichopus japonicus TaxID=307972 RepID=A0A1B2ZDP0_STIJA|nr:mitochondria ATP synthase subunit O-like protein [Apostichopus japonicus]
MPYTSFKSVNWQRDIPVKMATSRIVIPARQFTTSVAQAQFVKPPIQVYGTGGRYAHALYSAASKEKKLEQADSELKSFRNTLQQNAKLQQFLNNPVVKKNEKTGVVSDYLKGQKMSPLTVNFFGVLAENNRLSKLDEVFSAWSKIMSAHRGEVVCTVTTAKPLDANKQKQLNEALQGFLKKGEKLNLNLNVDAAVIGGMVVEIGDKYVDMSTATKVKQMTNLIQQSV